jgi:hypothetical protein
MPEKSSEMMICSPNVKPSPINVHLMRSLIKPPVGVQAVVDAALQMIWLSRP